MQLVFSVCMFGVWGSNWLCIINVNTSNIIAPVTNTCRPLSLFLFSKLNVTTTYLALTPALDVWTQMECVSLQEDVPRVCVKTTLFK